MLATKLSTIMFVVSSTFAITLYKPNTESKIVFHTSNIATGRYNFNFHTLSPISFHTNIAREEAGGFDTDGNYVVTGYYKYLDKSGHYHSVHYTADINGYHPLVTPLTRPPGAAPALIAAALIG